MEQRDYRGRFRKGQTRPAASGRKLGVLNLDTRAVAEIARPYGPAAIAKLIAIMNDPEAPHAAVVAATNSLLDRAYGKPHQSIAQTVDGQSFVMLLPSVAESEDVWLNDLNGAADDRLSSAKVS